MAKPETHCRNPGLRRRWTEQVMGKYQDAVFRYAYSLLGNRADAEDLMQVAFLASIRTVESTGELHLNPMAFLCTVVFRDAMDHFKRKKRYRDLFKLDASAAEIVEDRSPDAFERIRSDEAVEEFNSALLGLPEIYRITYTLRYGELGLTEAEIADKFGLTLAGVHSRLSRARLLLQKKLSHWIESPSEQKVG